MMNAQQFSKKEVAKSAGSRLLIGIPILIIILFLPAGTVHYLEAWIYLAVLLIPMAIAMTHFISKAPEFLIRRMKFRETEKTQQKILALAYIPFLIQFVLPGIDKRLGWSNVPLFIALSADAFVLAGYLFVIVVFKENQFASRIIEIDQKQKVISTGPYKMIRHPMYLGTMIMYIASPIALGSYWAIIPALFIIPVIVARIMNEEKTLEKELEGYTEYEIKTVYRLLPGVW